MLQQTGSKEEILKRLKPSELVAAPRAGPEEATDSSIVLRHVQESKPYLWRLGPFSEPSDWLKA